jgi:hypothetical protein
MTPDLIAEPTSTGRCTNLANASASFSWANLRKEAKLTLPEALSIFESRPAGAAWLFCFGDFSGVGPVSIVFFFLKRANVLPSIFALLYINSSRSTFSEPSLKRLWQFAAKVPNLNAKLMRILN